MATSEDHSWLSEGQMVKGQCDLCDLVSLPLKLSYIPYDRSVTHGLNYQECKYPLVK